MKMLQQCMARFWAFLNIFYEIVRKIVEKTYSLSISAWRTWKARITFGSLMVNKGGEVIHI